jgi:hypothetical protein
LWREAARGASGAGRTGANYLDALKSAIREIRQRVELPDQQ